MVFGRRAQCIGNGDFAHVFIPLEAGLKAAVVTPFMVGFAIGRSAIVADVLTTTCAVGIARQLVVWVVLVGPVLGVLVLGEDELVERVVSVVRQLFEQFAVFDFPEGCDLTRGVDLSANVREDGLVFFGDDVR